MMFQKRVDDSFQKLHDEKEEKDGQLTEEEIEAEKERLDWKDYLAMTVSAIGVLLPIALIVLLLMAVAGYLFLVR
ncbi:MAG: hypothetical protein IJ390_05410 [Lachnospiraceae bacterium]|nr:hypothetical protein [Lachnospiraceae bacterium]